MIESAMEGARRLALEAIRTSRRRLAVRRRDVNAEPHLIPGRYTCPECGRPNLKAHRADESGERPVFAHLAVSPFAELGRCYGSRGPGVKQD